MTLRLRLTSVLLAGLLLAPFAFAQLTPGNVVVNRIGDGTTLLSNAAAQVNLLEVSPTGTLVQTVSSAFTGANQQNDSGTATSNGYIGVGNQYIGVPGYEAPLGTASVAGTNTKVIQVINALTGAVTARVPFPTTAPIPYTSNNLRSVIPTGMNTFYLGGTGSSGTGGVWYFNGTEFIQLNTLAPTNVRNVALFGGQLFVSTGSGTPGIYAVGTGTPTTAGQTPTAFITEANMGIYGYVLFDTNNDNVLDRAYIADDRATNANGGINRWDFNGTAWSRTAAFRFDTSANTFSDAISGVVAIRGLDGYYDAATQTATLFATTTETTNNKLISFVDGAGAWSAATAFTTLQSAGENFVFRGVGVVRDADGNVPVELSSFTGVSRGSSAVLNWITASETNNAGFAIEQRNGETWNTLGFVEGQGTTDRETSYAFTTGALTPGVHAFRLRQTDFDGTTSFSPIVEVAIVAEEDALTLVGANPFAGRTTARIAVTQPQAVTVELFDVTGRRVSTVFSGAVEAFQSIDVDGTSLAPGMYILRATGERFVQSRTLTVVR